MSNLDRRTFVMAAGGAVALASSARVFAQTPGQRLAVRRPVGEMQSNDPMLASYRVAVERMKALPTSDPRNWERLARIHVDFCPHGNWFFLPWHRAYLVSFERLCRQLSGNPDFALPYWDWTAQRQLPPAFTAQTVAGRSNPLYDRTRRMGPGDQLRASAVGETVIARLMAETGFELFASTRPTGQNSTAARWLRAPGRTTALEGGPHNTTHTSVGGDMEDMSSPLDPIFWLHHCNVDRLWAQWNGLGHRNPSSTLWTQFGFNGMFVQPQGQQRTTPWSVGVSDVLDHRTFGYTYPGLPAETAAVAAAADETPEPRVLASAAVTGTGGLNMVLSARLELPRRDARGAPAAPQGVVQDANDILHEEAPRQPAPGGDAPAPVPDGRLFSVLNGLGAARGDAVNVNVFLNSPNPAAATADDPHFVGTFGLFGLQSHAAHGGGLSVALDVTAAVARLRQAAPGLGAGLDVQLIPVETRGDGLELKLERIDLVTM